MLLALLTLPALAQDLPWTAGTSACVAAPIVRLRKAPEAEAPITARLQRGDRVPVLGVGPETRLDGEVSRWVQVDDRRARAWVWGPTLATACTELELDGDALPERVLVEALPDAALRLHVRVGATRTWESLELGAFVDAAGAHLQPRLDVVPASIAGEPTLRVVLTGSPDDGGRDWAVLVSLGRHPDGRPRLVEAIRWAQGGDGDTFFGTDAAWSEDGRLLSLWTLDGAHTPEGGARAAVVLTRYERIDGIYVPIGPDATGALEAPAE